MSVKLLDAVTAVGAGSPQKSNVPFDELITFQLIIDSGSPSQVDIDIEGSIDGGTNYEVLLSHDVTAEGKMFHLSGKPTTHIRGNLKTLTGGGTVTLEMQVGER